MTATWKLCGFGDEIDPAPEVQVAVLQALGASSVEVRGAWDVSVVDWTDEQLDRYAGVLRDGGVSAAVIGSPIGKVDVLSPTEDELARLARVIEVARRLHTRLIRVFSFYCDPAGGVDAARPAVLSKMSALVAAAEDAGVVLVHENEKGIYGDTPERVLDVIESVGSPALRVAWDSANFVQVGVRPFADAYPLLAPFIDHLHVKDAVMGTGEVVPAGSGDGDMAAMVTALRDAGYDGFASLEPHLVDAHALGGSSGPRAFGEAARAFRSLTERLDVTLI